MPLSGNGRRRKDSFNVHDLRPSTWPDPYPGSASYTYPYVVQEHLHLPAPKLPNFTPTPRKQSAPAQKKTASPSPQVQKHASPPPQIQKHASPPPVTSPVRRRLDKVTPSSYTFASDSTKLGEIPQRNWTTPWDYEEAERLNAEAAMTGHPMVVREEIKGDGNAKKKGLFRWMRRGSGAGVSS